MPDQPTTQPKTPRRIQRGEIIALAVGGDSAPEDGKTITIQVLRAGEFVDMSGKEFDLTTADLDAYVANSSALVASEQVPVELGHPDDPGAPAAAWYRKFFKKVVDGVEWVCAEIELTALGAQSLADQLYKYFSANLWLDDQVICGGGFVNRPAVSGQQPVGSLAQFLKPKSTDEGVAPMPVNKSILQKAVDLIRNLGEQIAKLEMSHEDRAQRIRKAIVAKYGDPVMDGWGGPYIVNTYDDRVIVSKDDKCFAVPYSFNDQDDCVLGDAVEVEMTWTPKAASGEAALSQVIPAATVPITNPSPATAQVLNQGGEHPMTTPVIPASTTPAPIPAVVLPVTQTDPALSPEAQLAQVRQEAQAAAQKQIAEFQAMLAAERKRATEEAQAQMARKQKVSALSVALTTGKRQFPYTAEQLETILGQLTDADRDLIEPVLVKVHDAGLVEMGERGATTPAQGYKELPAYAKPHLQAWLAKKGTVAEFFAANPELGKADTYDLSEFESK